jgi:hypothetical protein
MDKMPKVFKPIKILLKFTCTIFKSKYKFIKKKEICKESEKLLRDGKKPIEVKT